MCHAGDFEEKQRRECCEMAGCSSSNWLCCTKHSLLYVIGVVALCFVGVVLSWMFFLEFQRPCILGFSGGWAVGTLVAQGPPSTTVAGHLQNLCYPLLSPSLTCLDPSDVNAASVKQPFLLESNRAESAPLDISDQGSERISFLEGERPVSEPATINNFISDKDLQRSYSRIKRNGRWFLFFVALNGRTGQGDIAMAWTEEHPAKADWHYEQVVLDESFSLSYPFVFSHQGKSFNLSFPSPLFSLRSSLLGGD